MRFTPSELVFSLLFLISVGALQVGYWIERRIIRRVRALSPDEWRKYIYAFGGMLRTGKLKRRMAMGGLGDPKLAALLKTLGRIQIVVMAAFVGAIGMLLVFRIGG